MTESNKYIEGSINILLISSNIGLRREISNILIKSYYNPLITNNLLDGKNIFKNYINTLNLIILCVPPSKMDDYIGFISMVKDSRYDIEIYIITQEIDLKSTIQLANVGISKLMVEPFNSDIFKKDLADISNRILKYYIFGKYANIYEDNVTKLPNKLKLAKDIEPDERYYLIVFNVDGFRQINDCFGVKAADSVSLEMARVISKYAINRYFRLYKIQIDEYALLITCKFDRIDYTLLVNKIINDLTSKPFVFDASEIYYNVSVGIATSEHGNKDIVRNAGFALTVSKTTKCIYTIYDISIETQENKKTIFWLNELKRAIANDHVILNFHPVVSNTTGEIEYFEALIRIKKEDGSLYYPNEFINISKEIRIYNQLTKIVLNKAVETALKYDCNISINLSFEDIINDDTRSYILSILEDENISKRIKFELTESESITNYESVTNFIGDINRCGSMIAIDDFGAGYSNYYNILRLNINYLKIDGSLIKNIMSDKYAQAIIKSVVDLTKQLNIKTIAEYVFNEDVHNSVKDLNIDYSQGYHISFPLTEHELITFINKALCQ